MSDINFPIIILVRPQLGENIGMAARAMYNGGLTHMRIVNPKEPWPNPKAVTPSAGAHLILDDIEVFDTLEEAIADLHFVLATSARPRYMTKHVYTAESGISKTTEEINAGKRVGILFGPERTGLNNDELSRADGLIEIPMNPDYTSLNLAQAVLIVAYEWVKLQQQRSAVELRKNEAEFATKEEMIEFFDHLEHELDRSGFLRVAHKRAGMIRNIRNMFLRTDFTSQEVRTLRGIISGLVTPYHKNRTPPEQD